MESNPQITVGTYIRELRKKKGISINDLVSLSEISKGYISQIENNKFVPSPEILEKIAKALDVPHLYLLEKAGHTKESNRNDILQMVLLDLHDTKKYKELEFQYIADQYGPNLNEEDKEDFNKIVKEHTLEIQKIDEEIEYVQYLIRDSNNKGLDESIEPKISGYGDPDISIEETKLKKISEANTKIDLEELFNSAQEITINGKTLTDEEKQKALQILKLTFDK